MKKTVLSTLTLMVLGIAIWWMSADVVWLGDDLDYKYRMKGAIWQSWGKIRGWSDLWESQIVHYKNVNGRFVAHFLVQLFNGILGQKTFAVCNAIVYALFAFIIAKCGSVDVRKNTAGLVTAASLSVICFVTKMMPTCQIGYIWGMTVNLLWLSVFFAKGRPIWIKVAAMSVIGIIVGNWQEALSVGVCAGLGIWWLSRFFIKDEKGISHFDWRRSWMMLGYFVGMASNCVSPSTLGRVSTIAIPFSDQLIIGACSVPAVLLLVFCIVYRKVILHKSFTTLISRKNISYETGEIPVIFLASGIIVLLIFNLAVGVFSNRQLFGVNLFSVILVLRILPGHSFGIKGNVLAAIISFAIWTIMYTGIQEVKRQYNDILNLHKESKDGSVEYDRTRVMILGHPLEMKYYEDIVGQFDNDLHHSMMKDFKHIGKGKTLKLKPATIPDREKVECYSPGHFNVTVVEPKKGNPRQEIMIYGHHTLSGIIDIPASPRRAPLLKPSRRSSIYSTYVIIPEYPLFTADSIIILPPKE